jgi:copper homeostasis protein
MDFKLEICVDSLQSALNAQEAGASRVELCYNLLEGGTTPGYGTIMAARDKLKIGLNVIVRPRGGDFLYTDDEYDIMCRDIELCRKVGADGIVIGVLTPDGNIDSKRTAEMVRLANPLPVTFHRAFDMCNDPYIGLKEIIKCGASRILTSGQKNSVPEGLVLIKELVTLSEDRIIIMPGGGIDENNISIIAGQSRAREYHLTARKIVASLMSYRKEGVIMGGMAGYDEFNRKVADADRIRKVISILESM